MDRKIDERMANIEAMSFEDAINLLEDIVLVLESDTITLDKAIDAYTKGMALKAHCQKKLEEARMKIEKINLSKEGVPVKTEPLNIDSDDVC